MRMTAEKGAAEQLAVTVTLTVLFFASLALFCFSFGYSLIIPVVLFFLGVQLFLVGKNDYKLCWNLGLLLVLILLAAHVIQEYTTISVLYLPVASIPILTMLLFKDLNLSFLTAIVSSLVVGLVVQADISIMIIFFLGGLAGAYTVRDARTRGKLISAGAFVSGTHLLCLALIETDYTLFFNRLFGITHIIPLIVSGLISAFVIVASLKLFESIFGVLTNYSLLELADFNQPLLKRMILEAPGTYHHSLVVSNLAEAAAEAIGADGLLTRVGAYYHDIGKMARSEYFTENQLVGGNIHDKIEPSMSRLVVLNHVKEGIDLAKKYNLNQRIIDFIPEHHGTGLMYYFYQKAVEDAEEGEVVKEEDFRYPGPKPQSRETAITLLADSVEGATRALDDPNPQNIEETVQKIINNKFIDGQLDECPLTLKEINIIAATFTRILSAMYHGRIKYPEKKNGKTQKNGHSGKRSAEKNQAEPPPDQDNSDNRPAR